MARDKGEGSGEEVLGMGEETPGSRGVSKVDHPRHYNMGAIEVIDFMEDQASFLSFHLLEAIAYICRSPHKGREVEDLEKAIWYIRRYSNRLGKPTTKDGSDVLLGLAGIHPDSGV